MEITIGKLKEIIKDLDDDMVLATLTMGNDEFEPFSFEKRLIVLKDISEEKNWGGKTYLTINGMGSHFTGHGKQKGLDPTGIYFE